jgi:chaperonin GroEL
MHATRAAVEEGVVAGGGTALLYATRELDKLKAINSDQQAGIDIVRRALQSPIRQIATNAGVEGSIVVGKLWDQDKTDFGYNAQTGEYEDLVKAGIIDPVKVVRNSLQAASSIAGLMITTEAMVSELPKNDSSAMPDMSGMGGMGGMGGMM